MKRQCGVKCPLYYIDRVKEDLVCLFGRKSVGPRHACYYEDVFKGRELKIAEWLMDTTCESSESTGQN